MKYLLLIIYFGIVSNNLYANQHQFKGIDTNDTRMLMQPAISTNHIAFIYAQNIWLANLDGSQPHRLTSGEGVESNPVFSPDGKLISFSAQYDGNTDVYIIPVEGGVPKRLTWHPAEDAVLGFTPDGKSVFFASQRTAFTKTITNLFARLFTVSVTGGPANQLEIPSAYHASYSPDGKYMAYTPVPDAFKQWKHYRGGQTSQIWLFSFLDKSIVKIPKPAGGCNDTQPMWINGTVYFRSDRTGEFNLYSYNIATKEIKQLTDFKDFPILNASFGNGVIIFERAGYLHIYNPALKTQKKLTIGIKTELAELQPRSVRGLNYIRSANLSATGNQVVFDFRGEIVTVSAENNNYHNITNTTGAHEKSPAWSPDGSSIAYFSDASGEYKLDIRSQDKQDAVRSFKLTGTGFYFNLKWSPDNKKIAYSDNGRNLYVLDISSGTIKKIDSDELLQLGPSRDFFSNWSPDSKWLVYTKVLDTHFKKALIYAVDNQKSYEVTDGLSDVTEPQFSRNGKYLYFFASTDAGPVINWFDQSGLDSKKNSSIYLLTLQDSTVSPLTKQPDKKEKEPAKETIPVNTSNSIKIDWDGIQNRILAIPVKAGNYYGLNVSANGDILYMDYPENAPGKMHKFSFKDNADTEITAMNSYSLSADGKKMLYAFADSWTIGNAGEKPETGKGTIAIDAIKVNIDPSAEWANILDEAWRIQRDYFYDSGMHGNNWPAIKKKYDAFLPSLTCRNDLNLLIQWMLSELSVGHSFINDEGDKLLKPKTVNVGLLGADYTSENNRYRFKKIFGGLNWHPGLRSPLTELGINIKTGDYLLAVNGKNIPATEELYQYFINTVGQATELTVGPNPNYKDSRIVRVTPINNEYDLRNHNWVEDNLQKVTEATKGQVAYVYVPNTAKEGLDYFKRYFYPQANRKAIIIDERFNGGGLLADYYINLLKNPYQANWNMRYGKDMKSPSASIQGPKIMLINESAGSGGDMLAWMFRKFKMGTLIGTRTWGGFIGVLGVPELLDGGEVTAPNLGIWTKDGWQIENIGISPDIEVEQLPSMLLKGDDPQLQKAIEKALKELKDNPPVKAVRPSYPPKVK